MLPMTLSCGKVIAASTFIDIEAYRRLLSTMIGGRPARREYMDPRDKSLKSSLEVVKTILALL